MKKTKEDRQIGYGEKQSCGTAEIHRGNNFAVEQEKQQPKTKENTFIYVVGDVCHSCVANECRYKVIAR